MSFEWIHYLHCLYVRYESGHDKVEHQEIKLRAAGVNVIFIDLKQQMCMKIGEDHNDRHYIRQEEEQ